MRAIWRQPSDTSWPRERLLGSPNLNSFGPNMSLAKELLERGEPQTGLEYFELCAKFWSHDRSKLKAWRDATKAGIAPDFQANLFY